MSQLGFFDLDDRYKQLSAGGDPLERLNEIIDWTLFLPLIEKALHRERKSEAGKKPYNRLMMFKMLVLQTLWIDEFSLQSLSFWAAAEDSYVLNLCTSVRMYARTSLWD